MYDFLMKKGQMIAFLVGGAFVVIHLVLSAGGGDNPGYATTAYNFGLYAGIVLAIVAAVMMVVGIAKYFMENPRQIKVMLGFIALFAVLGALIMMASGDIPASLQNAAADKGVTSGIYKYVNGSVNGTIILLVVAFLGLIVSEVLSLFK